MNIICLISYRGGGGGGGVKKKKKGKGKVPQAFEARGGA